MVAKGTALDLYIQSCGPGTVYFDDIFIACVGQPGSPTPSTSATGVSSTPLLKWTAGYGATSHDVYFGTNQTNVTNATRASAEYKVNKADPNYLPGTLNLNTTYY
jgi:hypothetical protein